MASRYDDEDFLQHIPLDPDQARSTHHIAGSLDCAWQTVNRRVTAIAEETGAIEVYDPREDTYHETQTNTGRLLRFRASPDYLEENNITPDDSAREKEDTRE